MRTRAATAATSPTAWTFPLLRWLLLRLALLLSSGIRSWRLSLPRDFLLELLNLFLQESARK